jgi:MFS family permease
VGRGRFRGEFGSASGGEVALNPAALSMISDYFPRERRGRALTFYNMGISLGIVLGRWISERLYQRGYKYT